MPKTSSRPPAWGSLTEETDRMSETTEIDPEMVDEAVRFGFDPETYVEMTPRERGLVKARYVRKLKTEARELGVDPDEFVGWHEDRRDEVRTKFHANTKGKSVVSRRRVRRPTKTIEEVVSRHVIEEAGNVPSSGEDPDVYTARDEVPPREADPTRRDKMTIGAITELYDPPQGDLTEEEIFAIRRAPPSTLQDMYSRWPIGEPDGHYYLRVERKQPRVYQGIPVAGYVGDIKHPISERQFQQYFGGREYDVTLYGPDPGGRHDANTGLPKVVRITKPIQIVVPILHPNLAVLPAARPEEPDETMQQHNPYAAPPYGGQSHVPTTPADAQIHKTNTDFVSSTLKIQNEELRRKEAEWERQAKVEREMSAQSQKHIFEHVRHDADARERILRDQLEESRKSLAEMKKQIEEATGRKGDDAFRYLESAALRESEAIKSNSQLFSDQIKTLTEGHNREMDNLRKSQDTAMQALREQHAAEIKRLQDRLQEQETYYSRRENDDRRKADDREKQLKEEAERIRREERDVSDRRVAETKERFEERIKDIERSHARELNAIKESLETRKDVGESQLKMELALVRERLDEKHEELERARAEAEESKDPVAVMTKAKEQAVAMGFKEDKDDPKTPWDRFATMAGSGVGQALQTIDKWLPDMVARGRAAQVPGQPGAPQLPPGAQPGAPQPPPLPQRRRSVAWATSDETAQAGPPARVPSGDLGFQGAPAERPEPPPAAPPPNGQPPPPPAPTPAPPQEVRVVNRLSSVFPDDQVLGFLQYLQGAIDAMEPEDFANMFFDRFPEQASRVVALHKPDDVVEMVKTIPGSDASPILRRDGQVWIKKMFAAVKQKVQRSQAPEQRAP
jgi:hypothetical protein